MIEEEGSEARTARHVEAARALIEGLAPLGFSPLVDAPHRLPMLSALRLPPPLLELGEAQLRRQLLDKYGIEVGGGLGSLAGQIRRIGLMGENARLATVEALLCALRHELG